jgi:hypothetical protein
MDKKRGRLLLPASSSFITDIVTALTTWTNASRGNPHRNEWLPDGRNSLLNLLGNPPSPSFVCLVQLTRPKRCVLMSFCTLRSSPVPKQILGRFETTRECRRRLLLDTQATQHNVNMTTSIIAKSHISDCMLSQEETGWPPRPRCDMPTQLHTDALCLSCHSQHLQQPTSLLLNDYEPQSGHFEPGRADSGSGR